MLINKKYKKVSREKLKKMFRVQWHLTERCNLKCIHCYQDDCTKFEEINMTEMKKSAKLLKKTITKWRMASEI